MKDHTEAYILIVKKESVHLDEHNLEENIIVQWLSHKVTNIKSNGPIKYKE